MFDEVEIREELGELGLSEICENGEFRVETIESGIFEDIDPITYSAPIIHVDGLTSFGEIHRYRSSRRLVFPHKRAVLKTGEPTSIGFFTEKEDHEKPEEKKNRKKTAITEFDMTASKVHEGLPAVKPVCLIYACEEDEYLLVEPKGLRLGRHMDSLLGGHASKQEELELTVEALGVFFRTLREHDTRYNLIFNSRPSVFEHMLRFDSEGGYRILVTDGPYFEQGYSPYRTQRDVLRELKRSTSGNAELATVVRRAYRKGYSRS